LVYLVIIRRIVLFEKKTMTFVRRVLAGADQHYAEKLNEGVKLNSYNLKRFVSFETKSRQ
jgi:hypothetical protein